MKAEIAIIGGSGVYSAFALKDRKNITIKTPYGSSPEITVGELGEKSVAFIPRHGKGHTTPPHKINYRANIWALRKLGVERILATTASGTLNKGLRPGDLALLTQFIDFTKSRAQTFYEGGKEGVVHIDLTEPYCQELRTILSKTAKKMGLKIHESSTYACMEGPRFETPAEIRALKILGADLVGMTNVPECVLARELGICYAAVAIVTNYAAGISKKILSHAAVLEEMKRTAGEVQRLFAETIPNIPKERKCSCVETLEKSRIKA
ncbi:MAG: S-methyl-5'-thioadenosine phosphorylase [Candidatus Hadarchaeales archaeon]